MGKYFTSGTGLLTLNPVLPTALYPGDDVYVWGTSFVAGQPPTPGQIQTPNDTNIQFEAVTVGERSLAVALAPRPGGGVAGVMVQLRASANPGVMEVDVQDAGVDADGSYITDTVSAAWKITVWTLAGDGTYVAWTELQPEGGRFISLKCITNPNAVTLTAKVSYV